MSEVHIERVDQTIVMTVPNGAPFGLSIRDALNIAHKISLAAAGNQSCQRCGEDTMEWRHSVPKEHTRNAAMLNFVRALSQ